MTTELLRPHEVTETKAEIRRLEKLVMEPDVQDRPTALRQLKALKRTLEEREPRTYLGEELDAAVRKERELREEMLVGMPTGTEMRKCPPGAVDKHRAWEVRNKRKLDEWRNVMLRLNAGSDATETTNFERFRPRGGAGELSMDGALIPGQQWYLPDATPTPGAVMTEAEGEVLRDLDPELYNRMGTLTGEQRAKVLEFLRGLGSAPEAAPGTAPGASSWTPERREAFGKRMAHARKAKQAAKDVAEVAA